MVAPGDAGAWLLPGGACVIALGACVARGVCVAKGGLHGKGGACVVKGGVVKGGHALYAPPKIWQVIAWVVCILLECILVRFCFHSVDNIKALCTLIENYINSTTGMHS